MAETSRTGGAGQDVAASPAVLGLDVVAVLVFVVVGRRSHDVEGVAGVLSTAAPFLVGVAAGWLASRAWAHPLSLRTGLAVWTATLLLGMALRAVVFDRGVAPSFVIVAALVLGALLIGWRLVGLRVTRPSRSPG